MQVMKRFLNIRVQVPGLFKQNLPKHFSSSTPNPPQPNQNNPPGQSYGLTNMISKDSKHFQPESGRYHLYISHGCPYAQRVYIVRQLKGLEKHITLSVAHPIYQKTKPEVDDHTGWVFRKESDPPLQTVAGQGSFSCKGCIPDTVNNCKTVRELYEISGNAPAVYSVPVLWDKKLKTIVNNESAQIMRIFNSAFNDIAGNPKLDLYPESLRKTIDEVNEWTQRDISAGVYKVSTAQSQQDYDTSVKILFDALDKTEGILSKTRYLCGNTFTEADIRVFPWLVRFDEIYYVHAKCNKKRIVDYPNLLNYCRDVYQMPGVAETLDMEHSKVRAYNMQPNLNPYGIVPVGPDFVGTLKEKHNRA